jgi:hypothetical protein
MAIIGRLIYSVKLELILNKIGIRAKSNSCALILIKRLKGSVDKYLIISV